jgi:hypothetical protein
MPRSLRLAVIASALLGCSTTPRSASLSSDSLACPRSLPRFEAFPTTDTLRARPKWPRVIVERDSSPSDLALAVARGQHPNYAGVLHVVEWGCGSPCQMQQVVDLRSGDLSSAINTAGGAQYRLNSRLLIANPLDATGCYDPRSATDWPAYYVWTGDSLRLIWAADTSLFKGRQ